MAGAQFGIANNCWSHIIRPYLVLDPQVFLGVNICRGKHM